MHDEDFVVIWSQVSNNQPPIVCFYVFDGYLIHENQLCHSKDFSKGEGDIEHAQRWAGWTSRSRLDLSKGHKEILLTPAYK